MSKFCVNCGTQLIENDNFCHNCGYKVGSHQSVSNVTNNVESKKKSKIVAGLLGIFLGWIGVHNFYLGYTGKAVAQLLISVLSCFVFSFASGIWGLIEGIMILTDTIVVDGNGNELAD